MKDKKLEVIPIAIRLFSEKGYNATSVEEIANSSGMAKGSFYKLFHSKEDLLLEIFVLLPKQIKAGLMNIYSKTYDSSDQKLIDFISMCFENILSSQTQILMDSIFTNSLFKNKETEQKAQQMRKEFHLLIKEFLLDIYGERINDYLGDFISLLTSLMFHHIHIFRYKKANLDPEKLAKFVATVFDIMVKGVLDRKPEPLLDSDMEWISCEFANYDSPLLKAQKIQLLLKQMADTINDLKLEDKKEYVKTLSLLEVECTKSNPQSFLLKALIHYLYSIPTIQADCTELKLLLELD